MPIPLKPCEGQLSPAIQQELHDNRARQQWALHRCETCGHEIGVERKTGCWVPERHWPSVAAHRTRRDTTAAHSRY